MVTFADVVLAHGLMGHLEERQIDLILDALEGEPIELSDTDRAALEAFAKEAAYLFGWELLPPVLVWTNSTT